jgi:pyridoxine kinase
MNRTLVISSQVASGHVGLSAIVPVLQAFGHEVIAMPTVILSNHPGHPHVSGQRIEAGTLRQMLDALEHNGWLADVSTILTGYLPTAEHVEFAADTIRRISALRRAKLDAAEPTVVCDPVLGDSPKGLYIDQAAAIATRDSLVPLADIILPNAFELGWLTGRKIGNVDEAVAAARAVGKSVLATSVPTSEPRIKANVLVASQAAGDAPVDAITVRFAERDGVPNGTGDALSALYVAIAARRPHSERWATEELDDRFAADPDARAMAGSDRTAELKLLTALADELVGLSVGRAELAIPAAMPAWTALAAKYPAADT